MEHETLWKPQAIGEAAPTRHPVAKGWQEPVDSGPFNWGIEKLSMSLVPKLSKQGNEWTSSPTHSWSASEIIPIPKEETGEASPEGFFRIRLQHRALDIEAHRKSHLGTLPGSLPPQSCVAHSIRFRMELSEARTSGVGKRRGSDCALETLPLAPYKKKLKGLAPISPSSMKAASCLFPISVRLGLPKGKLPFIETAIRETKFPPSPRLRSRPKESFWPFMSGFILTTSRDEMSRHSCAIFCDTSVDRLSCFGITALPIKKKPSKACCANTPDSILNGFPAMHLNSIRPSLSGHRVKKPLPIVRPMTSRNLNPCSASPYAKSNALKSFSGHVSMHPICHGEGESSFHYLYESQ